MVFYNGYNFYSILFYFNFPAGFGLGYVKPVETVRVCLFLSDLELLIVT